LALRKVSFVVIVVAGWIALVWGLIYLQGIFRTERDDALEAGRSQQNALKRYAREQLVFRLRNRIAEARTTIARATEDPLLDASSLVLFRGRKQILPRGADPQPGDETPAKKLYQKLRFELAELDPSGQQTPWIEAVALLQKFVVALQAHDQAQTEQALREVLRHRAEYKQPVSRDIPLMLALLDWLRAETTPHRSLVQALLRDGLPDGRGGRSVGLQRLLLVHRGSFTAADFTFMSALVVQLAVEAGVQTKDFEARAAAEPGQRLTIPRRLTEPVLLAAGQWCVKTAERDRVIGVAVDLPAVLQQITVDMQQAKLLQPPARISTRPLPQAPLPLTKLSVIVAASNWPNTEMSIDRRYRYKTVLVFAIGIVSCGIVAFGLLLLRRRQRFVELKSDFVSAVSHELRTPLASMRLMAETLEHRTRGTPGVRDYPNRLIRDIDGLSFLVENILSFEKLSKGRWSPTRRQVLLSDVIETVAAECEPTADRSVELDIADLGNTTLDADPDLLRLLFTNLFKNAWQYNQRNPVRIRITALEKNGLTVRFSDNGVGISKGEKERIFEDFYRGRERSGDAERGSGLGLAICRKVMQAHGGKITVAKTSQRGTTFQLSFPSV